MTNKNSAVQEQEAAINLSRLDAKSASTRKSILLAIQEIKSQLEEERDLSVSRQAELDVLKQNLGKREDEADGLREEIGRLKEGLPSMEGLKDNLSVANEELSGIKSQVAAKRRLLEEKDESIKDLQSKLIATEQERSKTLEDLRTEFEKSRRIQMEISKMSQEREEIIRERDVAVTQNKSLEAESARLKETCAALEEIQSALNETRNIIKR